MTAGVGAVTALRPAAGVRVRLDRADRRRGDRERRQRLPSPARRETLRRRCAILGHDRDQRSSSASRGSQFRCTRCRRAGRRRCCLEIARGVFPAGSVGRLHVLGRPGADARDPRPRREHVVPGLPAAGGAARARPLLRRASSRTSATGSSSRTGSSSSRASPLCCSGLQRERQLADPPLRDRRVHRVHALAGRDGALLAAHARRRLARSGRSSTASAPLRPASSR